MWQRTRRWDGAVRISIDGDYTTGDATKVAHTRDLIRRVIQRQMPIYFSPLSETETAHTQIVVVFAAATSSDSTLRRTLANFGRGNATSVAISGHRHCRAAMLAGSGPSIDFAVVQVSVEMPEGERALCVTRKLTQAMGFPGGRAGRSGPAVLGGASRDKLTLHDRALLWLLYHPEMSPGLSRDLAVRRTDELLRREGLK